MKSHYTIGLILLLALGACGPVSLSPLVSPVQHSPTSPMQVYHFYIDNRFQIAAVDATDAPLVEAARQAFAADLKAGRLEAYRQSRDFSIQLLAGSEGNYFLSSDLIQTLNQKVLAMLVVILPEQTAATFKGEFENQRFYFADPQQALQLSAPTKAYLLTADSNHFVIQTTQGEILPATQASTEGQNTSSTGVDPNAPNTENVPENTETDETLEQDIPEARDETEEEHLSEELDAENTPESIAEFHKDPFAPPQFPWQRALTPLPLPRAFLSRSKPALPGSAPPMKITITRIRTERRLLEQGRKEGIRYERLHIEGLRIPVILPAPASRP